MRQEPELLHRLLSFDLDGGPVQYPIAQKLADQQGWSREYAERVIQEYKRFLYLGATQGPVSPSQPVDMAWHLHLEYTVSYWERLCGGVLQKTFHHHPSKGGNVEGAKYANLYQDTLAKYRDSFGEAPPSDIWLATNLARMEAPSDDVWQISKPKAKRAFQWTGGLLTGVLSLAGCATLAQGTPTDSSFLWMAIPIGIVVIVLVSQALWRKPRPDGTSSGSGCSSGGSSFYNGSHNTSLDSSSEGYGAGDGIGHSPHDGHGHGHGDGHGDSGDGGSDGGGGDGGGGGCGGGGD